jgi:hypothetical protein
MYFETAKAFSTVMIMVRNNHCNPSPSVTILPCSYSERVACIICCTLTQPSALICSSFVRTFQPQSTSFFVKIPLIDHTAFTLCKSTHAFRRASAESKGSFSYGGSASIIVTKLPAGDGQRTHGKWRMRARAGEIFLPGLANSC